MFLATVSFSTFLSNLALYSSIAALLYSKFSGAAGGPVSKFKYHKIYLVMLLFVAANIAGLFTSGLGLAKIGKAKNVMAFLAFFLAFEAGAATAGRVSSLFVLQAVNFIMLVAAILSTALGLTGVVYLQDFVYWSSKYSGLFEVPITYGEFLVMLQCVSLSVLLGAKDSFGTPRKRGMFTALIAANMAALVLTYSRGPWAAMLLASGFILLARRYYRTLAVFCSAAVVAFLIVIFPPVKGNALLDDLNARVTSTLGGYSSGREVIYAAGLAMIKDHPLAGVGIGGVEKNYASYVKKIEWAPAERKEMVYGHLHNLYLQVYAETGLFGFAAFVWLCGCVLSSLARKAFGAAGGLDGAYAFGVLCSFGAVLVMGLSEYNMFNNEISRILWFYTGTALAPSQTPDGPAGATVTAINRT